MLPFKCFLPATEPARCPIDGLKCTACHMAKQHVRKPKSLPRSPHRQLNPNSPSRMAIRKGDILPGSCSIDQYVSHQPGRLPHTFGKEPKRSMYTGGTLITDHASQYIFLRNQVSPKTGETLQTKRAFDKFAAICGVKIRKFRADNHPFCSKEFLSDLEENGQEIDFCGVSLLVSSQPRPCIESLLLWHAH